MSDHLTIEQRHKNMAAVKSKDTKPEMVVRKYLWSRGFRYRVNNPRLPGHPDIVLRKYHTCIFVNGCFWHGHEGCKYFRMPKTNTEFWERKISRNKERDREEQKQLEGWGGTASPSGSVNWKGRGEIRRSSRWSTRSTISLSRTETWDTGCRKGRTWVWLRKRM